MKDNVIKTKSYDFALRIVKLHLYLKNEKREFELSKQILRSGTSIGANIEEAIGGLSRKDFSSRIGIAHKEARETSYWLRLLCDSGLIDKPIFNSLHIDCEEILRISGAILKTVKSET